jgi:acyl-coenzyme A synthetase/AMP-(fatty) acid ligase/acyl carrier protein
LERQLSNHQISVLFLTTALFHLMAQSRPEIFASLKYMVFGGDAAEAQFVQRVLERGKPRHLVNGYGPTEGTSFTTSYEAQKTDISARTIPIGRALSNTEVWILDRATQMLPVGVAGELYIGGDGLARGYLPRPELTAEKFVPHPYSADPGARLYRTGDLVRYRDDGNIEFLQRMDQQVKIRGFRIEPGEIEAALQDHPAVRESIVIVREETPGDKHLVAYVVRNPDFQSTVAQQLVPQLRNWLRGRLPAYMTPANFVVLDELPLNANGKVDRRALPEPDVETYAEETFIAPRTREEKTIAEIWAEVLGRPISVEANFFDLGGHSLLATRVISRIREKCGVELPLRLMFESATVAALASQLAAVQTSQTDADRIAEMLESLASLSEDETKTLLERSHEESQKAQDI